MTPPTKSPTKYAEKFGGVWYKRGTGWGDDGESAADPLQPLQGPAGRRFEHQDQTRKNADLAPSPDSQLAGLRGGRPSPITYRRRAELSNPATLFVPMFAPDEPDGRLSDVTSNSSTFPDFEQLVGDGRRCPARSATCGNISSVERRQRRRVGRRPQSLLHDQPDHAAERRDHRRRQGRRSRPPSTPWPPTATPTCRKARPGAGASVSSSEPFTEGRPDREGQRQGGHRAHRRRQHLWRPVQLGSDDPMPRNSRPMPPTAMPAMKFTAPGRHAAVQGHSTASARRRSRRPTTPRRWTSSCTTLCTNAKKPNVLVMTVSLDLDSKNTTEKKADRRAEGLLRIPLPQASNRRAGEAVLERHRRRARQVFKEIADELSNLRIVG